MEKKFKKYDMFSRNIRCQILFRSLQTVVRKNLLKVEATRANSNSSNIGKTRSYSNDRSSEKPPTIDTPVQDSSQENPSLKRVEPYSRELCQSHAEQTDRHYWTQNSQRPQVHQGLPQNNQCGPQKKVEATKASCNTSEKTRSYSTDSYLETLPTIETPVQIYTQGYPSLKRDEPYSREVCQSHAGQTNSQYCSQNSQWQLVYQGLPQNNQCWPQNNQWLPLQPDQICQYCCGYYSSTPPGGEKPPPDPCCPPCPYPSCQNPCYQKPCCQQPCCYPCYCNRCGPCSPNGNWCIPQVDCCGKRIVPPPECRPGPVPPNPCCPKYPKKGIFRIYRSIFLFICLPIIILQLLNVLSHERCPKIHCREYEFMRRRTKRFPWGDGDKTFFHNDEVNHLPSECEPPPMICEEIDPP